MTTASTRTVEGLKSASTLTGQVITVSSGLLAFTVTFVEKFSPTPAPNLLTPVELKVSWVCLIASIVFAFWALMALTGTLMEIDEGRAGPHQLNSKIPAGLMFLSFTAGLVFLVISGWKLTS